MVKRFVTVARQNGAWYESVSAKDYDRLRCELEAANKHVEILQSGAVENYNVWCEQMAALRCELAEVTADRDMARRSLDELQQRWAENTPAAKYKRELAEANVRLAEAEAVIKQIAHDDLEFGRLKMSAHARYLMDTFLQPADRENVTP